jgi:cyclin B
MITSRQYHLEKSKSQNFHNKKQSIDVMITEDNRSKEELITLDQGKSSVTTCALSNEPEDFDDIICNTDSYKNRKLTDYFSPQIPRDYLLEIYYSVLGEETERKRDFGYMKVQSDINEQMRAILIDWLVDVHLKFNLREETLFLTVNLIDGFLSKQIINRSQLQLLGVTALFVASKQEEIYTPHIKDLVFVTDNAYSMKEILEMETLLLKVLGFKTLIPSSIAFYQIISQFFKFTKKQLMFGRYLLESFLIDYRMTRYLPSVIACSCSYILMKVFKFNNYQEIYGKLFNANSNPITLKECANEICYLVDNLDESNLRAVKRKFSTKEYFEVSLISFS